MQINEFDMLASTSDYAEREPENEDEIKIMSNIKKQLKMCCGCIAKCTCSKAVEKNMKFEIESSHLADDETL